MKNYDDKMRENGLKDNINVEFVEKYHQRNKPEQKESIERIEKLTFDRLFSPFLKLKGELVNLFRVDRYTD
jgi:hypothetical protein